MMKKLLLILFLAISFVVNAQTQQPSKLPVSSNPNSWIIYGYVQDSAHLFVERDTNWLAKYPTLMKGLDHSFYYSNGNGGHWNVFGTDTSALHNQIVALQNTKLNISDTTGKWIGIGYLTQLVKYSDSLVYYVTPKNLKDSTTVLRGLINSHSDSVLSGGTISSIPTVGYTAPSNVNAANWIQNVFYQTQPPTSSLSGGTSLELHSAGTVSETLNWGAGRQAATATLASIIVGGVSQSFSQPSQGGTVTGTQSVTLTYNTNTTYYNVVTTTDSKSATSSTSFVFYPKLYIGFVASNAPSDADIIGVTNGNGGVFATNFIASGSLSTPSSSKYICIAYPASFGVVNNIVINGLSVTFNLTTRSFTNASGYSQSYNIYLSPNPTSGSVSSYSVN